MRCFQGTVPSDANQAIETHLFIMFPYKNRLFYFVFLSSRFEGFFTGCAKNGTSQCMYSGKIGFGKIPVFLVDHPRETITDPNDLHTVFYDGGLPYASYGGIYSRTISPGS